MDPDRQPDFEDQEVDDFPEFANQSNKRLNQTNIAKKKMIKAVTKQTQELQERLGILKQHLKNVQQQLVHTQQMIDHKNTQTQSENHMAEIIKRQIGRLQSQLRKLNKLSAEHQQRLNEMQTQIFKNTQKFDQLRLELNWNSQELEQWIIAQGQKQDDNKTMEKYTKEDNSKIRELNLEIQKYTVMLGRKQQQLQKQITQTQASQIELDKTAEQFKKQHQQRHQIFVQWQKVTDNTAKRTQQIQNETEVISELQAQIKQLELLVKQKQQNLGNSERQNKNKKNQIQTVQREIIRLRGENKKLQQEQLQNAMAQVQILKNQLSAFATNLAKIKQKIALLNQDMLTKKQRLQTAQNKYQANLTKLKNQQKLADQFKISKIQAQRRFEQNEKIKKEKEKLIKKAKDDLFKATTQLFKLRQQQANLYGEIQSNMAACRNLQSHINKLNAQFQRQQQLLYNAQYQIQLMERKVARKKGDRTHDEKEQLQKDIENANIENRKVKQKHKTLVQSVKKIDDDLRAVNRKLNEVAGSQKKSIEHIEALTLQNDMTYQDLNKVSKKKQQILVQHDIMKLEIKKIKQTLTNATNKVYNLQNKKYQMEMSMQQRQKQIQVHKDVLLAEHKAAEQQRHKIQIQLSQRKTKVNNLKIKYQSLVQKNHPGANQNVGQHSQAYYVIKAAQQKQQLQRKGDQLTAQITKSKKDLTALKNSLFYLQKRNSDYNNQLQNKGVSKSDLQQKVTLQQQKNAASQQLWKKKKQIQKIQKQYEQDMRRYTQMQNKIQTLNGHRKLIENQFHSLRNDLDQQMIKRQRAQKTLKQRVIEAEKKNIVLDQSNPHILQLQYDNQTNKIKTYINCLYNLANDYPQLSGVIENGLQQRNLQLPKKAPSSIDISSSKSGGSAISRASKGSKK